METLVAIEIIIYSVINSVTMYVSEAVITKEEHGQPLH